MESALVAALRDDPFYAAVNVDGSEDALLGYFGSVPPGSSPLRTWWRIARSPDLVADAWSLSGPGGG